MPEVEMPAAAEEQWPKVRAGQAGTIKQIQNASPEQNNLPLSVPWSDFAATI